MPVAPLAIRPLTPVLVKRLGVADYYTTWQAMRQFTHARTSDTPDELWVVQHPPTYTQGQAGKPEHIVKASSIPVVQTDRGGQVTYHGPGQLVVYPLIDIKRKKVGVRELVTLIENSVVRSLDCLGVEAYAKADAPGVYVKGKKIASLGLRVRKGCSFHGVSVNVDMDLSPFLGINPCGYAHLQMTQVRDCVPRFSGFDDFQQEYLAVLLAELSCQPINAV